jgi:hypothetical protein
VNDGRRWIWWLALPFVGVLVFLLAVLVADDGKSSLDVLRDDPLAQVRFPDAVDTRVTEGEGGSPMGISTPSKVRTTFMFASRASLEPAVDVLVDKARQHGWELEPRGEEVPGYSGFMRREGRLVQLVIAPSEVEPRVSIELSTRD